MPFANTAYFLTSLYWAKLKGCLKVQAMRTEALFFKTLFLVFLSFYIIATGNHRLDRSKRSLSINMFNRLINIGIKNK